MSGRRNRLVSQLVPGNTLELLVLDLDRRCPLPTIARKTRSVPEFALDGVLLLLDLLFLSLKRLLALQILLLLLLLLLTVMPFLLRMRLRSWSRPSTIRYPRNGEEINRSSQILPALGVILRPCLHIRVRIRVRRIVDVWRRSRDRLLWL